MSFSDCEYLNIIGVTNSVNGSSDSTVLESDQSQAQPRDHIQNYEENIFVCSKSSTSNSGCVEDVCSNMSNTDKSSSSEVNPGFLSMLAEIRKPLENQVVIEKNTSNSIKNSNQVFVLDSNSHSSDFE